MCQILLLRTFYTLRADAVVLIFVIIFYCQGGRNQEPASVLQNIEEFLCKLWAQKQNIPTLQGKTIYSYQVPWVCHVLLLMLDWAKMTRSLHFFILLMALLFMTCILIFKLHTGVVHICTFLQYSTSIHFHQYVLLPEYQTCDINDVSWANTVRNTALFLSFLPPSFHSVLLWLY